MALILGVFDLLAYAVPGSLYLATFAYVSHRAGWIDAPSLLGLPVTAAAHRRGGRRVPDRGRPPSPAREPRRSAQPLRFDRDCRRRPGRSSSGRNAIAAPRRFLQLDPFTLLAALEVDDSEAAAEVSRLRATGLMLSRSVPALALGAVTALVEIGHRHASTLRRTDRPRPRTGRSGMPATSLRRSAGGRSSGRTNCPSGTTTWRHGLPVSRSRMPRQRSTRRTAVRSSRSEPLWRRVMRPNPGRSTCRTARAGRAGASATRCSEGGQVLGP